MKVLIDPLENVTHASKAEEWVKTLLPLCIYSHIFMYGMHVCLHVCVCGSIVGECTCVYTHVSRFSAQVHSSILIAFHLVYCSVSLTDPGTCYVSLCLVSLLGGFPHLHLPCTELDSTSV